MNHLGLFAKFWSPGAVKTRLAVTHGDRAACALYQAFLFHLLSRHRNTAQVRTVVFSPANRESEFRSSISRHWQLSPQSIGDLGQRMQSFFSQQFQRAASSEYDPPGTTKKIVVIGADCPQLDQPMLEAAFEALERTEVVIGPSTDGGYYLIGMRNQCFDIFSNVQWSTSSVLEQTLNHLENQRVEYGLLSPLTDVDEYQSLISLIEDLERRESKGQLDKLDLALHRQIGNLVGGATG